MVYQSGLILDKPLDKSVKVEEAVGKNFWLAVCSCVTVPSDQTHSDCRILLLRFLSRRLPSWPRYAIDFRLSLGSPGLLCDRLLFLGHFEKHLHDPLGLKLSDYLSWIPEYLSSRDWQLGKITINMNCRYLIWLNQCNDQSEHISILVVVKWALG